MAASPITPAKDGIRLALRLTPKASRDQIGEIAPEADGGAVLKVSVTTVPEDGKANAALIALLAKKWKLAKSSIEIIQGATDRRKTLFIEGEPDELARRILETVRKP